MNRQARFRSSERRKLRIWTSWNQVDVRVSGYSKTPYGIFGTDDDISFRNEGANGKTSVVLVGKVDFQR
ncbi:hypothetical protein V2G26_010278 [Clonostachys chloroleuca]